MQKLNTQDLAWLLRRAPRPLLTLMKEAGPKLAVAGGYIRGCVANEPVNDIDCFVANKERAELYITKLRDAFPGSFIVATDNAYTLAGVKTPIQIVHRWTFDQPEDVVPSFDFTVASACFWWDGIQWRSQCHADFYADLAAKRLVYLSPERSEDAGGSMLRVLKFYQRGYRIPLDSLGAVIARLVGGVNFDEARSEHRIGKVITSLLVEVDPDIDPGHVAHLPTPKNDADEI